MPRRSDEAHGPTGSMPKIEPRQPHGGVGIFRRAAIEARAPGHPQQVRRDQVRATDSGGETVVRPRGDFCNDTPLEIDRKQ
jgi:hypothetical protein